MMSYVVGLKNGFKVRMELDENFDPMRAAEQKYGKYNVEFVQVAHQYQPNRAGSTMKESAYKAAIQLLLGMDPQDALSLMQSKPETEYRDLVIERLQIHIDSSK